MGQRAENGFVGVDCGLMDQIYRIDGQPKQTMTKMLLRAAKEKIGLKNLLGDLYSGWRAL